MSLNFKTQKIVIIVGAVVGITIILVIPYLIIRHVRRFEIATNMQKNNERLFREHEQRDRTWAGSAGELEHGIGTRAEDLPLSEHAGNTNVNRFGGSRTIHTQPQAPPSVYMSNNRNTAPTRRPDQPTRPGRTVPCLNHPASNTTSPHVPDYDRPSDVAQHQEDVPPAYSAVVPHR